MFDLISRPASSQALSQFGENYELISYVLPGRDRKACKNKFKAEDKKNTARINHCLNNRQPYGKHKTLVSGYSTHLSTDIQTLSRLTGKDFSGPTPVIRARETLQSSELAVTQSEQEPQEAVRESTNSAVAEAGVGILGHVGNIEEH